jgi:hypothetical protein
MPEENLITPTYQDIIILSLNTIITRMMEQDYLGAWIGLKTLYHILPPKCKEECKDEYEKVIDHLGNFQDRRISVFEQINIDAEEQNYLSIKNYALLETFKNSLFAKGYLVFESNRPPTRESSMKDLEFTMNKALYGRSE